LEEQKFHKRWGAKTLGDYWAFSSLSGSNAFASSGYSSDQEEQMTQNDEGNREETASSTTAGRSTNPATREYYLQDAPLTEEKMQASDQAIASALYHSGMIYNEDLRDPPKGIKQWEELASRYPDNKLYPSVCYQLYRTYKEVNNIPQSDYYKDILLTRFPNTDYAELIKNPNYYLEIEQKAKEAEQFYDSVYNTYAREDYPSVVTLAAMGLDRYKSSELSPKFAYLQAIALGKLYGMDTMVSPLTQITLNYPSTAIDTAARELLEAIQRVRNSGTEATPSDPNPAVAELPQYAYKPDNLHFIVFVVNIKDTKIDPLKNKIYGFNKEFFRFQQFDISNIYLDDVLQMVTISKFENKDKAMDYYHLLKTDSKYYKEINQTASASILVISDNNYTTFYKNKNLREDYQQFFNQHYLTGK
jgi:hypothetical protein